MDDYQNLLDYETIKSAVVERNGQWKSCETCTSICLFEKL